MIMGILNVTPDSFSDGGQFLQPKIAISHAVKMVAEGASIIDVGGESTRPGALPVPISEQVTRVVPVIEGLREVLDGGVRISIDAREPEVAARALDAGANMINDISGGANPEMLSLAAGHRIPIVLMHMQGSPESMQIKPDYVDVVKEIWEFLNERADLAISAGISPANIIIDPGIGFGKTRMQNLDILRHLEEFVTLGYVVALGTSRKRFMGSICQETTFKDLVGATCATTVIGVRAGVRIFRVHDVRENRQAMEVALAAMGMKSRFAG
tara:strand:- start:1704 stop:2513 length:810 start_codon:yes stop_codon:yes gene_type:complete